MSRRTHLATICAASLCAAPLSASALESPWFPSDKSEVRLVAGGLTDSKHRVGVEIRLAPGWHTYWRYPGDAGVPPRFNWTGSVNVAAVEVRFPAPERISESGGLSVIGYRDHVLFPLRVQPADPSKPVKLSLLLDFAVCEKICIPAQAKAKLDIPVGVKAAGPDLAAAEARVPKPAKVGERGEAGIVSVRLERASPPRVVVEVAAPAGKPAELFAEGPTEEWALPLPVMLDSAGERRRYAVTLEGGPSGANPVPSRLRLTLVAGESSVEVETPLD